MLLNLMLSALLVVAVLPVHGVKYNDSGNKRKRTGRKAFQDEKNEAKTRPFEAWANADHISHWNRGTTSLLHGTQTTNENVDSFSSEESDESYKLATPRASPRDAAAESGHADLSKFAAKTKARGRAAKRMRDSAKRQEKRRQKAKQPCVQNSEIMKGDGYLSRFTKLFARNKGQHVDESQDEGDMEAELDRLVYVRPESSSSEQDVREDALSTPLPSPRTAWCSCDTDDLEQSVDCNRRDDSRSTLKRTRRIGGDWNLKRQEARDNRHRAIKRAERSSAEYQAERVEKAKAEAQAREQKQKEMQAHDNAIPQPSDIVEIAAQSATAHKKETIGSQFDALPESPSGSSQFDALLDKKSAYATQCRLPSSDSESGETTECSADDSETDETSESHPDDVDPTAPKVLPKQGTSTPRYRGLDPLVLQYHVDPKPNCWQRLGTRMSANRKRPTEPRDSGDTAPGPSDADEVGATESPSDETSKSSSAIPVDDGACSLDSQQAAVAAAFCVVVEHEMHDMNHRVAGEQTEKNEDASIAAKQAAVAAAIESAVAATVSQSDALLKSPSATAIDSVCSLNSQQAVVDASCCVLAEQAMQEMDKDASIAAQQAVVAAAIEIVIEQVEKAAHVRSAAQQVENVKTLAQREAAARSSLELPENENRNKRERNEFASRQKTKRIAESNQRIQARTEQERNKEGEVYRTRVEDKRQMRKKRKQEKNGRRSGTAVGGDACSLDSEHAMHHDDHQMAGEQTKKDGEASIAALQVVVDEETIARWEVEMKQTEERAKHEVAALRYEILVNEQALIQSAALAEKDRVEKEEAQNRNDAERVALNAQLAAVRNQLDGQRADEEQLRAQLAVSQTAARQSATNEAISPPEIPSQTGRVPPAALSSPICPPSLPGSPPPTVPGSPTSTPSDPATHPEITNSSARNAVIAVIWTAVCLCVGGVIWYALMLYFKVQAFNRSSEMIDIEAQMSSKSGVENVDERFCIQYDAAANADQEVLTLQLNEAKFKVADESIQPVDHVIQIE